MASPSPLTGKIKRSRDESQEHNSLNNLHEHFQLMSLDTSAYSPKDNTLSLKSAKKKKRTSSISSADKSTKVEWKSSNSQNTSVPQSSRGVSTSSSSSSSFTTKKQKAKEIQFHTTLPLTNDSAIKPSDVSLFRPLASGAYGQILKIQSNPNSIIKIPDMSRPQFGLSDDLVREINIYSQIDSPYVAYISDVQLLPDNTVGIIMPIASSDLFEWILSPKGIALLESQEFGFACVVYFMKQLIMGLDAIHQAGFIHKDLKPENILVYDSEPENFKKINSIKLQINDMGLVMRHQGERSLRSPMVRGTPMYNPLEVVSDKYGSQTHDSSQDIWALGHIMYVLCAGHNLIFIKSNLTSAQINQTLLLHCQSIFGKNFNRTTSEMHKEFYNRLRAGSFSHFWSDKARICCAEILELLIRIDPLERPTTQELLESDFKNIQNPPPEIENLGSRIRQDISKTDNIPIHQAMSQVKLTNEMLEYRKLALDTLGLIAVKFECTLIEYIYTCDLFDRIFTQFDFGKKSAQMNIWLCFRLVVKCTRFIPMENERLFDTPYEFNFNKLFNIDSGKNVDTENNQAWLYELKTLQMAQGKITTAQFFNRCGDIKFLKQMVESCNTYGLITSKINDLKTNTNNIPEPQNGQKNIICTDIKFYEFVGVLTEGLLG